MSYSQQPPNSYSNNPMQNWGNSYSPQPQPQKSSLLWLWILLGVLGGGFALLVIVCGGTVWYFTSPPPVNSAIADQPFTLADVPVTQFPPRGTAEEIDDGVNLYEVQLPDTDGDYTPAGNGGRLWIYLPKGDSPPASRPCVIIAPAGSTMMEGMSLGDGDMDEHIPYVQAGFVVVAYELDGHSDEDPFGANSNLTQFQASKAGLVNARNALEYTLKNLEMVDAKRIYTAGHSSAGTAALLFAEHEPRLAGCIAFAPAIDVENRLPVFMRKVVETSNPGANTFLAQSSPKRHVDKLKCPTFLFTAEDDDTISVPDIKQFHTDLQAAGGKSTLKTVPVGGHYDPMIEEGIPAAIEWLKTQGALK